MQSAMAEKCQEKWQTMNLQLNHVMSKWEHSDQGDAFGLLIMVLLQVMLIMRQKRRRLIKEI